MEAENDFNGEERDKVGAFGREVEEEEGVKGDGSSVRRISFDRFVSEIFSISPSELESEFSGDSTPKNEVRNKVHLGIPCNKAREVPEDKN